MKKILILTAGFGEGEDVAAWNVRDAIERLAPDDSRVEVLDLLDSSYGRFRDLLRNTFQAALNRAPKLWQGFYQLLGTSQIIEDQIDGLARLRDSLRDALRNMQPDVVVTTCPIYSFLISEIYRDGRTRDFTLIALVTDSFVKDSPWLRTPGDFFCSDERIRCPSFWWLLVLRKRRSRFLVFQFSYVPCVMDRLQSMKACCPMYRLSNGCAFSILLTARGKRRRRCWNDYLIILIGTLLSASVAIPISTRWRAKKLPQRQIV